MENMDLVMITWTLRLSPTTSNLSAMDELQEKLRPLHTTTCTRTQDLKRLQEELVGVEGAWGPECSPRAELADQQQCL